MHVVLRVDVGPQIGSGHLVRCQTLAEALERELGATTQLVTTSSEDELESLGKLAPDLLVVDLYQPSEEALMRLSEGPWRTLVFDENTGHRFACDLVANPNLDFLRPRCGNATQALSGKDAIVLRSGFQNPALRLVKESVRNILVCLGGGAMGQATASLCLQLADKLPPGASQIRVVLPARHRPAELEVDERWQFVERLDDMAAEMTRADLGVVAAGTLLYEACVLGLPTLAVAVNKDQEREALWAAKAGATLFAGELTSLEQRRLRCQLLALESADQRQQMARNAQAMLDGQGLGRILAAIGQLSPQQA